MSSEEVEVEIKKLAERNDKEKPMVDWNKNILFVIDDLSKGYHAFFAEDGTISEMKTYDDIKEEDIESAYIVLQGKCDSWLALLRGEMKATRAILMRKIKAKKGSIMELAPFTKVLGG